MNNGPDEQMKIILEDLGPNFDFNEHLKDWAYEKMADKPVEAFAEFMGWDPKEKCHRFVPTAQLYLSYKAWCNLKILIIFNIRHFSTELHALGFKKDIKSVRNTKHRGYWMPGEQEF